MDKDFFIEALKSQTKIKIIEEAMALFIENGIKDTTMLDIAKKSGIARRTLYRYYKTKKDLAFEIAVIYRQMLFEEETMETLQVCNGYEKLKNHANFLFQKHKQKSYIKISKFLAEYDHYFLAVSLEYFENKKLVQISENYRSYIEGIIKEGICDKSISDSIDPFATSNLFVNIHISLAHKIALTIKEEDIKDSDDSLKLLKGFYEMFLKFLK